MKGYHVTFYEYLDSILEEGLIPKNTTEENFPWADDNRHEAVFFMTQKINAHGWYEGFHPRDFYIDPQSGEHEECNRGISVIIEFDLPGHVKVFKDPYSLCDGDARYTKEVIRPEWIVDIHDPIL